ncbi:MAG: hypothetical protein KDD45_05785, partial [Bdellovibrionales bacterium]|nr:hypothetical protein [Bdellovibrionales bacterium]
ESLKATSNASMVPLSYEYTTLSKENQKAVTKKIEAKFNLTKKRIPGKKTQFKETRTLIATLSENGKISKIRTDLPKDTFMSYFLVYLMLKSKTGIQTGSKYEYTAIAEEKAKITEGVARVSTLEDYKGFKAYKIENRFDNQNFISYVTNKGETIGVVNPGSGVEAELVGRPKDAIGEFPVPTTVLKTLFGEVPLGTDNIVSKALKQEAFQGTTNPPGSKQFGMPAGTGLVSKPKVEHIEKPLPKVESAESISKESN